MTFQWSEVTAVFGGTFDPPHLGHREAVRGLFKFPAIKRVLVIPSGTPPFKSDATSTEHRFKMTELGFAGLENVHVDRRETDRYTFDTLQELRPKYSPLAFVVGADQLALLPTWHRFPELLQASHWIILARKPDGEAMTLKTLTEWEASGLIRKERRKEGRSEGVEWNTGTTRLKWVHTDAPAISSNEIREKIARETDSGALLSSLQTCLQPAVLNYLMEHRIYGMSPTKD